jgi:hypothetical protein
MPNGIKDAHGKKRRITKKNPAIEIENLKQQHWHHQDNTRSLEAQLVYK